MDWLSKFDLYLFDLDGLLVNTEAIHFAAYRHMCAERGCQLDWTFKEYCQSAHYSDTGLQEALYSKFPSFEGVSWDQLYAEKKAAYIHLIKTGPVELMPWVEPLLLGLQKAAIPRCVVTHSASDLVRVIRDKNPILESIPHWYTREDYDLAKPAPDGYQKAIDLHSQPGARIVGFEDSPRGLKALMGTQAKPVLVCPPEHPGVKEWVDRGVDYFPDLSQLQL